MVSCVSVSGGHFGFLANAASRYCSSFSSIFCCALLGRLGCLAATICSSSSGSSAYFCTMLGGRSGFRMAPHHTLLSRSYASSSRRWRGHFGFAAAVCRTAGLVLCVNLSRVSAGVFGLFATCMHSSLFGFSAAFARYCFGSLGFCSSRSRSVVCWGLFHQVSIRSVGVFRCAASSVSVCLSASLLRFRIACSGRLGL